MSAKAGLYWLASYPKSGNTWFRVFLANLLNKGEGPVDLNRLNTGSIASARFWVDDALGFDSALFSHDELEPLRHAAYAWYGLKAKAPEYHKIHDAYTYLENGEPLMPKQGCLGALYFIRNPLDVSISYANHSSCSIDQSIKSMASAKGGLCHKNHRQFNQLRQQLLSWSLHVKSWADASEIPVKVIRYEDMKHKPIETFTNAVRFLELSVTDEQIQAAIEASHIDKLKAFEAEFGFSEKPARVAHFFRKGQTADWQETLSAEQVKAVIDAHGEVMQRFGYLDEHNNVC